MTKAPKAGARTRHDRRAERTTPEAAFAEPAIVGEGYLPTLHADIRPDPENPRKIFDEDALVDLAESVSRDGLLEPLVLRQLPGEAGFMLIAGERRWRAIGLAIKNGFWPADRPIPAMVREVSEQDARRLALVENLQRRDLKPVEEARALQQLAELTGASAAQIGRDLGFTERWAQQRLSLLKLPEAMQQQVEAGTLTVQDGREAVSLLPKLPAIKQVELREGKITVAAAKAWAASRPQPLELEPVDQLTLLELAWAIGASRTAGRYTDTQVDCHYRKSPLFSGSGLWSVTRSYGEGRDRAVVGFAGWDHLRAITGSDTPLVRELLEPHLRKARTAALAGNPLSPGYDPAAFKQVDALYKAKRYVTPWLNPPFAIDPGWKAQHEEAERQTRERAESYQRERQAEDAAREKERAEARAAVDAEVAAGRRLLEAVLTLQDAAGLADLLQVEGYVGPFRVDSVDDYPTIVDATGKPWTHRACGLEALRRIMALGLNLAVGHGATSGPAIEDAPWARDASAPLATAADEEPTITRHEFERYVANCLVEDLEIAEAQAAEMARRGLDVFLQQAGVEYGAHRFSWDFDNAMALAERIRVDDYGQQVDLESAIEAQAAPALAEAAL